MSRSATDLKSRIARSRVEMYDMTSGKEHAIAGSKLIKSTDPVMATALEHALQVDEFMRTKLGRDGWDGKGSPLRVVVHVPNEDGTPNMANAYWHPSTKRVYLGDGDGRVLKPIGTSLDALMHEVTHAIVQAEIAPKRYGGQQGGVNESWADVLGVLIDPSDWLIGEDLVTGAYPGKAIRDLENPRYKHMSEVPSDVEVNEHDLAGIPSLAAVRVAQHIGVEAMGKIWYQALTDHLDPRAGFAGAARATLDAAAKIHGDSSSAVTAVQDAWNSVGVDPRWKGPAAG